MSGVGKKKPDGGTSLRDETNAAIRLGKECGDESDSNEKDSQDDNRKGKELLCLCHPVGRK